MDSTPRAAAKIDQHAARDDRMELLDTEAFEPVGGGELPFDEAVVEAHLLAIAVRADLHADVAETVELGADLADLGRQELVVPDDLVGAERAAGRRAGDPQR